MAGTPPVKTSVYSGVNASCSQNHASPWRKVHGRNATKAVWVWHGLARTGAGARAVQSLRIQPSTWPVGDWFPFAIAKTCSGFLAWALSAITLVRLEGSVNMCKLVVKLPTSAHASPPYPHPTRQ